MREGINSISGRTFFKTHQLAICRLNAPLTSYLQVDELILDMSKHNILIVSSSLYHVRNAFTNVDS